MPGSTTGEPPRYFEPEAPGASRDEIAAIGADLELPRPFVRRTPRQSTHVGPARRNRASSSPSRFSETQSQSFAALSTAGPAKYQSTTRPAGRQLARDGSREAPESSLEGGHDVGFEGPGLSSARDEPAGVP